MRRPARTSGQNAWTGIPRQGAPSRRRWTGQIARTFHLQLKEAESQRATRGRTENLEAVDYARTAWAARWNKPSARETNDQAFAYLEKALALDPHPSPLWTNPSYAHTPAPAPPSPT